MELLDKKIGEKLKKLREDRNLTQRYVADEIGVAYSYISRIENGKIPSLDKIKKLCDLYGVPVSSLFGEETELDDGLKSLGVEWITFAEDMEDKNISPDELKQALSMLKLLKKL